LPTLVGPEGSTSSQIALIGEAPGAKEDQLGRPFVGPAGKLLDDLLRRAGIARSECYITNVVKERPKQNNIKLFLDTSRKLVKQTREYDHYEDMLKEELEQVSANVLVAVGGTALWALCRERKVTKRRGSILPSTLVEGRKVIPIIHPAACLKWGPAGNEVTKHLIVMDLLRVKADSAYPELNYPKVSLLTHPSYDDCMNYFAAVRVLAKAGTLSHLAFDIETAKGELSCISFSTNPLEAISIPLTWKGGQSYFSLEREAAILREIDSLLGDPSIRKLGQNLIFDMTFLFNRYGIVTNSHDDTMIAQAIICPDLPRGLDFIASVYTRIPYYKDEGKARMKSDKTPDEAFWEYNAKDSLVCQMAWPSLKEDLAELDNLNTYYSRIALTHPLMFMQEHGILMRKEGLYEANQQADEQIQELTSELHELADYDLNPNSPKQLAEYFYDILGHKAYISRKSGSRTTDVVALKRLSRKGVKEAGLVLEIRRLAKAKGTYYSVQLDEDSRLRCSFNPVGAADTGRLSSSKTIFGGGANLQNQTPEMKRLMLADPDHVIYTVDLKQAENRVVAYIAPEPRMIAAFEAGQDIHKQTASLIYARPEEDITDAERQMGKRANHGLNYGQSYKGFALIHELPENDAKFIVERYHQAYPGVREYHGWVKQRLNEGRILETPLGRKRLFLKAWGDELWKEAYSFIPQSTVGEMTALWGVGYLYSFNEVTLLNIVHDSVVFEMPLALSWQHHSDALRVLEASLSRPLVWNGREFSIPCEFSMGLNMKDTIELTDLSPPTLEETYESLLRWNLQRV
jgi:uracil-DNA glycosylase family 4